MSINDLSNSEEKMNIENSFWIWDRQEMNEVLNVHYWELISNRMKHFNVYRLDHHLSISGRLLFFHLHNLIKISVQKFCENFHLFEIRIHFDKPFWETLRNYDIGDKSTSPCILSHLFVQIICNQTVYWPKNFHIWDVFLWKSLYIEFCPNRLQVQFSGNMHALCQSILPYLWLLWNFGCLYECITPESCVKKIDWIVLIIIF